MYVYVRQTFRLISAASTAWRRTKCNAIHVITMHYDALRCTGGLLSPRSAYVRTPENPNEIAPFERMSCFFHRSSLDVPPGLSTDQCCTCTTCRGSGVKPLTVLFLRIRVLSALMDRHLHFSCSHEQNPCCRTQITLRPQTSGISPGNVYVCIQARPSQVLPKITGQFSAREYMRGRVVVAR